MKIRYFLFAFLLILSQLVANAQNTLDLVGLGSGATASAAYSLRKLSSSYTGPLVRIQVGSSFYDVYPDASTGIFATSSKISSAIGTYDAGVGAASSNALSTIISAGSTNATVAIWYDQRGSSAVNLIQDAQSQRPPIISAGSIIVQGSAPAVQFIPSSESNLFQGGTGTSFSNPMTLSIVFSSTAVQSGYKRILNLGGKTRDGLFFFGSIDNSLTILTGYQSSWYYIDAVTPATNIGSSSVPIISTTTIIAGSNGLKPFYNGTLKNAKFGTFTATTNFSLGATLTDASSIYHTDQLFAGKVSELIFFPSALSDANRLELECSQSAFSGTATSNSCGPTITTSGISSLCYNAVSQTSSLSYSASTESPTSYSIDWDGTANTAGLTDQASTSFAFSSGGGTLTGINVPAGLAAATYNGTMTISNGSKTATKSVSLIINALPTISGTLTVCVGSTTQLSGSASAASSNAWVSATPAVATVSSSGLVTGVSAGTSIITYTNSNGCTKTATVTVNPTPSLLGNSLNFDGTNDYITVPASSSLNITGPVSISAWVKRQTSGKDICIVGKDDFAAGTGYSLWIYGATDNHKISFRFGNRGCRSSSSVPLDEWTHVAATYDGTTTNVYINGVLSNSCSGILAPTANSANLYIGTPQDNVGDSRYNFLGSIDNVAIYNTAVSASDINFSMKNELVGNETGLVAYYDDNSGVASGSNAGITSLLDKTSNGQNGTLTGFALSGSTSNWVDGPAISNSTSTVICLNSTIQLSHSSLGVWSSSNAAVASVNSTGLVTALAAGTATITYTVTNGYGCSSTSTANFTVSGLPGFSLQLPTVAQTICTGTNLTVDADPGSGTISSYKWYSNASALNSGGTLIVTNSTSSTTNSYAPASSAYFYVVATNSYGCSDTSDVSGAITVIAAPIFNSQPSSSSQTLCLNGTPSSFSVTATAGGGTIVSYKWYSNTLNSNTNGQLVSTSSSSGSYTPSTSNASTLYYYCEVTNSNGCKTASAVSGAITTSALSVGGTAVAASSVVTSGGATTISLSGYTGSIQWQQSADGSSWSNVSGGSGATSAIYSTAALSSTTYYKAILTNGVCSAASSNNVSVTVSISGVVADILVLGAGGSGGAHKGGEGTGGGGGGGVAYVTGTTLLNATYTITVAGTTTGKSVSGSGCGGGGLGNHGANSVFTGNSKTITAIGGGGGGGACEGNGSAGGSGGGGHAGNASTPNTGGDVTLNTFSGISSGSMFSYGNIGGTSASFQNGGGGGGASVAPGTSLNGGAGVSLSITGAALVYGSGGGANCTNSTGGSGGSNAGNGSSGYTNSRTGTDATANFGGGGGGNNSAGVLSGSGGSGVVVISYASPVLLATGGTTSSYVNGGVTYQVHKFISSGSFVLNALPYFYITSAGTAATVCSSINSQTTTMPYSASGGSGTSYTIDWNAVANTAGLTDQTSTSYTFVAGGGSVSGIVIPAGVAAGTYTGTMTISNGSSTITQSITLAIGSVSGTISGAGTVTAGTNSSTLTLSGYSGSIQWQSSTNNSTFSNIGGATAATYIATNLTATTFYRAIVTNGACASATSSTATITIASPSTAFGISGSTTANTISNNVATVVDPAIAVIANGTISGFTVTITGDYTDGDLLGYSGSLPFGVTASLFNTTSRSINFSGTASAADWQTLLRTVTLTSTSNCYPSNRKVSFLPSNKYYNYFNGHYYEYVPTALSWSAAKSAAASRSYYGRQGYLVTISSESENNYIWKLIAHDSWIGLSCVHTEINAALGYNKYGSTTYGQFYWVTGPEKGILVSTGLGNSLSKASGIYSNWATNEPNNYKGWGENSGHMLSGIGYWNDYRQEGANNGRNPIPYIIEFGGLQGDDTSATISFTRDIIISGSPVGSVTGAATVCNGTNSTTLTYSGGGTIQNWEFSTDNFATVGTPVASTSSTLTTTNLSSSRYYRAVVNTVACSNLASSSALITVATTTAGTITATSADICAGGSAALTLNGNSGDIQKWQVSTSSDFTTDVTDISNTTNTLSHALSSNGTYYFRASVLNSACIGGTALYTDAYPVTVTTGTPPVGGTVNSIAYCGGSNDGTLTLSGSTGTSYQWEVSTDGGVAWSNASSTNTTQAYTGISTTTKYRVLVTNGSCGSVYSSVGTITIGGTSGAQWTGTVSTDWGNTANWCGYIIGDDGLDVEIKAGATYAPTLDRNRVIGNLNFNASGKSVTLGNYTLTASSIFGASSSNYIKTTGTGKLQVSIGNGITTSLPVGNTAYNPVSITNNNSTSDYFSVKVLDEVYANSLSGSLNTNGRVQRTWDITKTNANSGSGVDFVFNWNAGETSSLTIPTLYNYSGGSWVKQTGTTSYSSTSLTYTGYTGTLSSFAMLQSSCIWTGAGGDDLWNTAGNWSTGTAPLATTEIVISSGSPKLNVDYAVGGTLTISGTGTLTINPGKTLSISSGGVVDFGGKSVTIKSDVTGTGQLGRIQGTLIGATNVTMERYIPATGRRYRMLTPSVNTSTSIKTNWMEGNMNTSGTNVNTVAGFGTQITGPGGNANGFDVTGTNAASLYLTTNGVTPGYASISNTTDTLSSLTGYFLFVRGNRSMNMNLFNTNVAPNPVPLPSSTTTLRATGTVVQGTVNSFTNTLSSAAGGFSLVTNPYPAAIDWESVYAASSNINNYYTYWDPNLGFRGGFTTVSPTISTPSSLASKTIQSGQAFFVTTAANGLAAISIQESHKVGVSANNVHGIFKANKIVDDIVSKKVKGISPVWENYQPNLQPTVSSIPEFRISLYYTEASGYKRLTDGAVALFDNQYTSALDGSDAVDAPNWDENIAISRNGQNLAIESRAQLNENDTLAISMSTMKSMNYELQFQGSNFGSTLLQPLLIDNYLKTLTPLSLTVPTTVPFTVTSDAATSSKDRFMVVFKTSVVLPFTVTKITATKKNETVQVDWEVKTDEDLKSFDVERSADGRNFAKLATVTSLGKGIVLVNYSWVDNNPLMGENYYRIKVIPLSGKEKVSPVAMATFDKNSPTMVVYPNPTEGNDFSIKLSNLTKGIYQIIVTSLSGQQVLVKSIEHPGGMKTARMVFENDISKGVYRIQVKGEGLSLLSNIIKN
jgi:hypothetical protein